MSALPNLPLSGSHMKGGLDGAHIGGKQDALGPAISSKLVEDWTSPRRVLGGAAAKALATSNSCSHKRTDLSITRKGIIPRRSMLCNIGVYVFPYVHLI